MSRLANKPITVPAGVKVEIKTKYVEIIGAKKTVSIKIFPQVKVSAENNAIRVDLSEEKTKSDKSNSKVLLGTMWALLKNSLIGVSENFKIELELVGVGYRAQAQSGKLNLTLGYSHPVVLAVPEGIIVETPSQTEVWLFSFDNQLLGQFAAEICSRRPEECYKGKGIRIKAKGKIAIKKKPLKEAKKK